MGLRMRKQPWLEIFSIPRMLISGYKLQAVLWPLAVRLQTDLRLCFMVSVCEKSRWVEAMFHQDFQGWLPRAGLWAILSAASASTLWALDLSPGLIPILSPPQPHHCLSHQEAFWGWGAHGFSQELGQTYCSLCWEHTGPSKHWFLCHPLRLVQFDGKTFDWQVVRAATGPHLLVCWLPYWWNMSSLELLWSSSSIIESGIRHQSPLYSSRWAEVSYQREHLNVNKAEEMEFCSQRQQWNALAGG